MSPETSCDNGEIGRRVDVVGIFHNDAAAIRQAAVLLIEQNHECLVGRRYLSEESLALVVEEDDDAETAGHLLTGATPLRTN